METGELTDRIAARVKEKLEQMGITVSDSEITACMNGSNDASQGNSCSETGTCESSAASKSGRRILLILTEEEGTNGRAFLENSEITGKYNVQSAVLSDDSSDNSIDMERIDTVVLYNLTCANLSKLCVGMADTPYLKAALQALMSGKRLLVSEDEIEYLRYRKNMPSPMWKRMSGDLEFLKSCGLTVVPAEKLVDTVMDRSAEKSVCTASCKSAEKTECAAVGKSAEKTECAAVGKSAEKTECAAVSKSAGKMLRGENSISADGCEACGKECIISRKAVTERDVIESVKAGATCIRVRKDCIITDLARETAERKGIRFCCD
ncbi:MULTISPECIES: hypothetical protein [unclassified Bilifractor]|uniref:hypothetical protein n=1 Tax=unclassified Bilifractor TaxID=2815795 RepID=UPI003F8F3179